MAATTKRCAKCRKRIIFKLGTLSYKYPFKLCEECGVIADAVALRAVEHWIMES